MSKRILFIGAAMLALAACQPKTEEPPAPAPAPEVAIAPQTDLAAPALPTPASTITVDLTVEKQAKFTDKLMSPLQVEGVAPARWFFEAVFPVKLVVDGVTIAEAPAQAQEDWTNGNPTHPYRAMLSFTSARETQAELVFAEDMPGMDDKGNDVPPKEIRIPVTLVPPK